MSCEPRGFWPVSFSRSVSLSRRQLCIQLPAAAIVLATGCHPRVQDDFPVALFSSISRLLIPDAVQAIRTAGWSRPGLGAARYVYDASVDRVWVARFPGSSVISANNRGFRLATGTGDVRLFGAIGDGKHDDAGAINEALSHGGTVLLPGPATYRVADRLLVSIPRTRLLLGESVTLKTEAWRYRQSQEPFGNAIHITADDCEVLGSGPSSVIASMRSDANGIGFLHCGGGKIARLTLRGGKHSISAIKDDTFQSGISIVNDRAANKGGRASATIVEDCGIIDWMQYGLNIYGNLASGIQVYRTTIARTGKSDDRISVGAGVAITKGAGPILLEGNTISGNKGFGIFVSSAGDEIRGLTISLNKIIDNGLEGICLSEERHFGASGTIGQRNATISRNMIERNGAAGVRVGTYDGVGSIGGIEIVRNNIADNRRSGVLLQANVAPQHGVSVRVAENQLHNNGDFGLAVGEGQVALEEYGNSFDGNGLGLTIDHRTGKPRALGER